MTINGEVNIYDEQHLDALTSYLINCPPPQSGQLYGSVLCVDLDDAGEFDLDKKFPYHVQKGTVLCPPPSAIYKQIDGDADGFVREYQSYLANDELVMDFESTLLIYLKNGGRILIYSPAPIDGGVVWLDILLSHIMNKYGIIVGTDKIPFTYNPAYEVPNARNLFANNGINVLDFIYSVGCEPNNMGFYGIMDIYGKVLYELEQQFCYPGDDPQELLKFICVNSLCGYPPAYKPAIMFSR